jgi:hypothetical protein
MVISTDSLHILIHKEHFSELGIPPEQARNVNDPDFFIFSKYLEAVLFWQSYWVVTPLLMN